MAKIQIRSTFMGMLLGALATVGIASAGGGSVIYADRLVNDARVELSEIRALLPAAAHDQRARREVRQRLNTLDGMLYEVDITLDTVAAGPQRPGPNRPGRGPAGMILNHGELNQIRVAINNEAFADDKMAVLLAATAGRPMTTAQARSLVNLFTFDDDKVEAAVILYPQVVDPEQWFTMYSALTFRSSKDTLRAQTR
ncbi:MAG: DUF4476 domain-containing protein [Myxococcota bacterium]